MDAQAWDRRYAGAELVWKAEPNRFVVEATAGLVPGRALDLACGEGRNAVWLATLGWQVVGVDFSPVGLHKARALATHVGVDADVTWVCADVVAWLPEAGEFGLVLLSYLHLARDARRDVLAMAASALAVGGALVVVGHDRANLGGGFGGPQDPAILLDADELLEDLSAGPALRVEQAGRVARSVLNNGVEHTAIDTLLVAIRRPS